MEQGHAGRPGPSGLGGQVLDDGARQDLDEAAADGVDGGGQAQAREGRREQLREQGHEDQAERCQDVGQHHGRAVADAVDDLDGGQVGQQLDEEVEAGEQAEPGDVDAEPGVEDDEEQRRQVVDDRLHNEARVGGADKMLSNSIFLLLYV